ncbi:MAG: hypothetical protein EBS55_11115 [Flavobacteriaceae bacterium]|nr:hypothetical protein [Flavobacteriaceae bacterium]
MNPKIIKFGEFNFNQKDEKKQIVLTHTKRNLIPYIQGLKYRFNQKNKKIPHFIISKSGEILQLLDLNDTSKYFGNQKIDKQSVTVSFENLGWLEKVPLKMLYINWIGDIYKGEVHNKKWRDRVFWDLYTGIQINEAASLCNFLLKKLNITAQVIGHNTKIENPQNFEGILTRSNFEESSTDLSPHFDFEEFEKKIKK